MIFYSKVLKYLLSYDVEIWELCMKQDIWYLAKFAKTLLHTCAGSFIGCRL